MTTTGRTTMPSSSGQAQAMQPHASANGDGKPGKFGPHQAAFAQLLGKATQAERVSGPATNPTRAPAATPPALQPPKDAATKDAATKDAATNEATTKVASNKKTADSPRSAEAGAPGASLPTGGRTDAPRVPAAKGAPVASDAAKANAMAGFQADATEADSASASRPSTLATAATPGHPDRRTGEPDLGHGISAGRGVSTRLHGLSEYGATLATVTDASTSVARQSTPRGPRQLDGGTPSSVGLREAARTPRGSTKAFAATDAGPASHDSGREETVEQPVARPSVAPTMAPAIAPRAQTVAGKQQDPVGARMPSSSELASPLKQPARLPTPASPSATSAHADAAQVQPPAQLGRPGPAPTIGTEADPESVSAPSSEGLPVVQASQPPFSVAPPTFPAQARPRTWQAMPVASRDGQSAHPASTSPQTTGKQSPEAKVVSTTAYQGTAFLSGPAVGAPATRLGEDAHAAARPGDGSHTAARSSDEPRTAVHTAVTDRLAVTPNLPPVSPTPRKATQKPQQAGLANDRTGETTAGSDPRPTPAPHRSTGAPVAHEATVQVGGRAHLPSQSTLPAGPSHANPTETDDRQPPPESHRRTTGQAVATVTPPGSDSPVAAPPFKLQPQGLPQAQPQAIFQAQPRAVPQDRPADHRVPTVNTSGSAVPVAAPPAKAQPQAQPQTHPQARPAAITDANRAASQAPAAQSTASVAPTIRHTVDHPASAGAPPATGTRPASTEASPTPGHLPLPTAASPATHAGALPTTASPAAVTLPIAAKVSPAAVAPPIATTASSPVAAPSSSNPRWTAAQKAPLPAPSQAPTAAAPPAARTPGSTPLAGGAPQTSMPRSSQSAPSTSVRSTATGPAKPARGLESVIESVTASVTASQPSPSRQPRAEESVERPVAESLAPPAASAQPPQGQAPRASVKAQTSARTDRGASAASPVRSEGTTDGKVAPTESTANEGQQRPQTGKAAAPTQPQPHDQPPVVTATVSTEAHRGMSPAVAKQGTAGEEAESPSLARARAKRSPAGASPTTDAPSDPPASASSSQQPQAAQHGRERLHSAQPASATTAPSPHQPAAAAPTSAPQAPALDPPRDPLAGATTASATQLAGPSSPTVAAPLPLITTLPLSSPQNLDFSSLAGYQSSAVSGESAPIFQRAADEPGLAVTVLPHAAHLSVTSDSGDLSLHVRVRDGNADVNVSGSMASLFESKAPEMRTVLGNQGLGLSSFAADQHGGGQHSQQRPESAPAESASHAPAPVRRGPTSIDSATTDEGRIHITA